MIRANGFDRLALKMPDEGRPHVEKLARRPARLVGFDPPCVEKPPAVIEG